MSSFLVLTDAIEALLPHDQVNVYRDEVEPTHRNGAAGLGYIEDDLPWVVLDIRFPRVLGRSPAATAQGGRVVITTTLAGLTKESVQALYDLVHPHLEGARPEAEGWNTSPITEFNARDIATDHDMTFIDSNRKARFAVVEWEMTVSRK